MKNENENTMVQHFSDAAKFDLRGKITAMQAYLKKQEKKSQINILTLCLKELAKEEQRTLQTNRRKEIIKIRAKLSKIVTKQTIEHINETRSWFFDEIK